MRAFVALLTTAALCVPCCNAVNLFVAQTDGNLTTLALEKESGSMTVASRTQDCRPNAAGIELDFANRVLYCTDRGSSSALRGNVVSFSIGDTGALTIIDKVDVPPSGVAGAIIGADGNRAMVSASYNKSAIAVLKIDVGGVLGGLDTATIQEILPTIAKTGPYLTRQDRSYSHDVLVTPAGDHVFVSELGGDGWRVFEINSTSLELLELPMLATESGVGPRHGAFYTSASGELSLFFNGELDQKVHWYTLNIAAGEVTWEKKFEIPGLGTDAAQPATTAPTSEIAITPDNKFLVVSHRDYSFATSALFRTGPSDRISTFSINDDGTLTLIQLAPSGGYSPRQFSINAAGDMIAIGHQNNRTVVVWERDLTTGKIITEAEGGPLAQITLSGAVVATVWDE